MATLLFITISILCSIFFLTTTQQYVFVDELVIATAANQRCQDLFGTHLASIHSASDNLEAQTLCVPEAGDVRPGCWIGLHDYDAEAYSNGNLFKWYDGTALDYTNWDSNEPNNYYSGNGGEDLVMISQTDGLWNDGYNAWQLRLICWDSPPDTVHPTFYPTFRPTLMNVDSLDPTLYPISSTIKPTIYPSFSPSFNPVSKPSFNTVSNPTFHPTFYPTITPMRVDSLDTTVHVHSFDTDNQSSGSSRDIYTIIGVICILNLFCVLIILACCCYKRVKRRRYTDMLNNMTQENTIINKNVESWNQNIITIKSIESGNDNVIDSDNEEKHLSPKGEESEDSDFF